ncbi:hypothetical protein DLD77_07310 [Chitinophaga alhagiae]|uniref:DUF3618 domain-containing protein n=1 Tax=Chitinophaga alhagiae TaxID=2203219 RepID=A0ABN5LUV9_9BACT|nr:hypothetical protein [Chitinophaga alhagiae]AWO01513.1 hypothetical protein DLD77_07310 [Chitinophaga alhagiae]
MPKVKVKNMEQLDVEIQRLQEKTRRLENELGERLDYLKGNYRSMAMNTVVPGIANSGVMGIVGGIAKTAWKSGAAKSVLTSALMTAIEFIGVRLGIKLFNNIRGKRHRRKAAKQQQGGAD